MTTQAKSSPAATPAPSTAEAAPIARDKHDPCLPHPVPATPEGAVVEIGEIATRLSRLARWCGGGGQVCSVAEHSVLVAKIMETTFIEAGGDIETPFIARALLFGLLHDAHEAFTGDMTRQVQDWYAGELPGFTDARARLNAAWDEVIFEAAGIGAPEAPVTAAVAHADDIAAEIERGVLFSGEAGGEVVHGWTPVQARHAFMTMYDRLQAVLRG